MAVMLWADTHFNHRGILRYCAPTRPYASVEEMNESMIAKWNTSVRPQDTIYLLGDFGFETGLDAIFKRLHGKKHLVIGNHDEKNTLVLKLPWESQRDIVTLRENGVRAVACHYPMETWKSAQKGYLMLHGHSHGNLRRQVPHRFDVGADVFTDGPVSLQEIAAMAAAQNFTIDEHVGD
jgi:calcineurin-like phosphoesterase family protein